MPEKPAFDVLCIMRNSAKTLPRLFDSLAEYQARSGRVIIVDTGSSDDSVEVARARGAEVTEAGDRFMHTIDEPTAKAINERFIVPGEEPVVQAGSRYFHFAEARNFGLDLATNDWVTWIDSDEAFVRLDIDKINEAMANPALSLLEYHFCYAWQRPPEDGNPDDFGIPGVEFVQAKTFRRSRMSWGTLPVHELVTPLPNPAPGGMERALLPKEAFYLGHWQQPSTHRANYLVGLSIACFQEPTHDRESHYYARELMYCGRPKSAIKEFERHIALNRWPAERAQSLVFMGDCHGALQEWEKQAESYARAFYTDPTRRVALLRLAAFFKQHGHHQACSAYASAALEIPWSPFYANDVREYRALPYALRYHSRGWSGDVTGARQDLLASLQFEPFNPEFARDVKFFFGYDVEAAPEGWMVPQEMIWLFETASKCKRVLEVGSWKGRSTHALCTATEKTGGAVWAVDHFKGSVGEDIQHAEAKAAPEGVYLQFIENTKQFTNLRVRRADSLAAAKDFPDNYFDMLFLDGSHDEESVRKDIAAWSSKVKAGGILAGHDWGTWPGVVAAVKSTIGEPDGVHVSIWWKKRQPVPPNQLLQYLTSCIQQGLPCSFVKFGDGEAACIAGEKGGNCDGHPYTPELAWKLKMAFAELHKMAAPREGRTWVNVVPFEDQVPYNCILYRNTNAVDAVKDFYGAIRDSAKPKCFVGPARLKPAAVMLKAEFVEIPLVNAFSEYDKIREALRWKAKPGSIFVFCASMMAKPLIAGLLAVDQSISCIDAGSAFDPLFVGKTRTEQVAMDVLLELHADWLESDPA